MRFTFNGSEYSIEFKREFKEITRFNGEVVKSRFPYTTVTLFKGAKKAEVAVRTATVGAFYAEKEFTHEKGRLYALRSISRSMNNERDLKKALWKAYISRPRG